MKKSIIVGLVIIAFFTLNWLFLNNEDYYVWESTNCEILQVSESERNFLKVKPTFEIKKNELHCLLINNTFKLISNSNVFFKIPGSDNVLDDSLNSIQVFLVNNGDSINLNEYILKIQSDTTYLMSFRDDLNIPCCDKDFIEMTKFYNKSFFYSGDGRIIDFQKFGFLFEIPQKVKSFGDHILKLKVTFKSGKEIKYEMKILII